MLIQVRISNGLTNTVVTEYALSVKDDPKDKYLIEAHTQLEIENPDCHVNFTWPSQTHNTDNFICGMPLNMVKDEKEMRWQDYMNKWYKTQY